MASSFSVLSDGPLALKWGQCRQFVSCSHYQTHLCVQTNRLLKSFPDCFHCFDQLQCLAMQVELDLMLVYFHQTWVLGQASLDLILLCLNQQFDLVLISLGFAVLHHLEWADQHYRFIPYFLASNYDA